MVHRPTKDGSSRIYDDQRVRRYIGKSMSNVDIGLLPSDNRFFSGEGALGRILYLECWEGGILTLKRIQLRITLRKYLSHQKATV